MPQNNQIQDKKLGDFHEVENRGSFRLAVPRLRFLANKVGRLIRKGRLLDIGFGDGFLLKTIYTANRNFNLFGIDISKKNVEITQKQFDKEGIKVVLKQGSIDSVPFPDNYFDVICASEVLEHLDDITLSKGISEIRRVLKDGGYFLATVPANENLEDLLTFCPECGHSFHRWGHKQSFNKERLKSIFVRHGFMSKIIKRVSFFGEQLKDKRMIAKIKFYLKKVLFGFFKKIFAPQWWFYIEAKFCKKILT